MKQMIVSEMIHILAVFNWKAQQALLNDSILVSTEQLSREEICLPRTSLQLRHLDQHEVFLTSRVIAPDVMQSKSNQNIKRKSLHFEANVMRQIKLQSRASFENVQMVIEWS